MKKLLILAIPLILLGLLSGCASMPSPSAMQEDIKTYNLPYSPEPGKGMVYVVRPDSFGTLVRFNVFLDSKGEQAEMGYTRGSEYIYFNVSPGDHQILSNAENWAYANVTVRDGETVFIKQQAEWGIIMARNSLVIIPPYEGKYHIKHSEVGTVIRTK